MMAVVVMMVVRDHATIHVSTGKCGTGECDCGESRDEFNLVHCRVPFVIRASPFSRLHKDRTIRRNFLTKDFEAVMLGASRDTKIAHKPLTIAHYSHLICAP
jgi:hypothetical protein